MLNIVFNYIGTVSLIVFIIGLLLLYDMKNEIKQNIAKGFFCASVILSIINVAEPKVLTADTYTSIVQVKITDQQQGTKLLIFRRSYFIPFSFRDELAVEYDGQEYRLKENDLYEKYKDMVGTYVSGILETTVYVDGSVHKEIIGIKDGG